MRWAFVEIRREMLRNRREKALEEIKELDEKLGGRRTRKWKDCRISTRNWASSCRVSKRREKISRPISRGKSSRLKTKTKRWRRTFKVWRPSRRKWRIRLCKLTSSWKRLFLFRKSTSFATKIYYGLSRRPARKHTISNNFWKVYKLPWCQSTCRSNSLNRKIRCWKTS